MEQLLLDKRGLADYFRNDERTKMGIGDLSFSEEVLLAALNERLHEGAHFPRCEDYFTTFGLRAEELESQLNLELAAAFRCLGAVTSLRLNPDQEHTFESYFSLPSVRSPILDEFSSEQLDLFASTASSLEDPELRARLADVVWVRKRNHLMAAIAVTAYIESGRRILASPVSTTAFLRFERAIQIAAMLGKGKTAFDEAIGTIENIAFDSTAKGFVVASSLDLLLQYKRTPDRFAKLAETWATHQDSVGKPLWQRRFWELAARFFRLDGKPEEERRAKIEVAKTFEREADEALGRDSAPAFLVGSHFLEHAIQAYRRVPGTETDRARIHRKLTECQQRSIEEFPRLTSKPIDLSDSAKFCQDLVRGKPLDQALRILAEYGKIPSVAELRAAAESDVNGHPMAFLFPASSLSATGKVVAKQRAMSENDPDDRESLLRRQMFWHLARIHRPLIVSGHIEPMRYQIIGEHFVRYDDLLPLVSYNALVPPGREYFYVLGLHAGLHGRFVEALHILIPQFENSIRHLLFEMGEVVSTLDAEGLQKELDLNVLLYLPKTIELFGEDLVFSLRGLLVEQASSNFRNQMSHGMLEYGAFFSETAVYIWWLLLRMCVMCKSVPSD